MSHIYWSVRVKSCRWKHRRSMACIDYQYMFWVIWVRYVEYNM